MRFKTIDKDKPDYIASSVRNAESSATIPLGTPVVFAINGTQDGLAVVLPSSSTAVKATNFFAGVATKSAVPGEVFDALSHGFCLNVLYSRGSRSATTAAWPSFVAIALGDMCTIDTVQNAFAYSTVGAAGVNAPIACVADTANTAASTTTAASSAYTQWTGSYATILMKMVIRAM